MATIPDSLPPQPLSEDKSLLLDRLITDLDAPALMWLSGYMAGLARKQPAITPVIATPAKSPAGVSIVYGSQTGNAKHVAEHLAYQMEAAGLPVRLARADAYPMRELTKERLLYIVISTQGDGDPPDDAHGFVDFLAGRRAPRLESLSFAVLGLGDSSYPQFCAIGRKLDTRLAELGAKRLFEFSAADLDIETVAGPWAKSALTSAQALLKIRPALASVTQLHPHVETAAWSAARPLHAAVLANQRITAADSTQDVRHLELDTQGAGLNYEPGDSVGVLPRNPPLLVDAVLDALHLNGDMRVAHAGETHVLHEWLTSKRELTRLSRPFLAVLAERSGDAALKSLLEPEHADGLRALLDSAQPVDLLARHRADWSGEALVSALRPLASRLYSIASSRSEVGEEAHLTVAHVEYRTGTATRWGAASHWLATRAEGDCIDVYLERNERFRLPRDPARDIIMVGPGTGVAPFRAFVQERAAAGASGRNWLFFGNPHFRCDFLYQTEWQAALKAGSLARLDVAFSRDQAEKVYVQQRLREHGRDLFDWLENGAHFYVCGAAAMARDVESALREVIAAHGGRSAEGADEYLAALPDQHRYARDVY